jgi:hypothetical protein
MMPGLGSLDWLSCRRVPRAAITWHWANIVGASSDSGAEPPRGSTLCATLQAVTASFVHDSSLSLSLGTEMMMSYEWET